MAKTDSIKTDFYINYLTQAQFDALETKEADQIYLTPDASITQITAGDGLSGGGTSGIVNLSHSNSVSAKSALALYPIAFDAQGHITDSGNAITVPTITLNGSSTTSPSFYAPTSAGTSGYFLKSNGTGAPTWVSKPTYTASEVGALPSSHTYTTSIAESTGTNQITLGYGKKYSLTAGGTSYIFTMPSADDTNTWRTIQVNGSDILTGGTNTNKLNLKAGTNMSLSNSSGTVTINGPDLSSYALKSEIPTVSYPVTSVNSKTGAVSLTYSDVGAAASGHTHTTSIATSSATNQITLAHGTKYAITAGGTSYVFTMPADNNTTYSAGTGLSLSGTTFSVKLGYSTSGNNRAVQADSNGNLYVVQTDTDTNTTYSAGTGLSLSGTTFNVKLGYTTSGNNRAVKADSNGNLYVEQKDDNTTYTFSTSNPTLSWGTTSTIGTAGGTTYKVTMPANPNTDSLLALNEVTSTSTYYPIVGNGTSAQTRQYDTTGWIYSATNGTTSAAGSATITLGNNKTATTANNKQGKIVLYGSTAYTHTISGAPSGNRTITLPDKTGTVALTSDIPTSLPASDVYSWAKASSKPSYTASEVGALSSSTTYVSTITTSAGAHSTISSKSGAVSFNVPTKTSHLTNDSGFLTSHQTAVTSLTTTAGSHSTKSSATGAVSLAIPTKTSHLTNDSGFITSYTDTKDTAGSSNKTGTKMYLVAATSQSSNITTYSNSNCYIGTDNCLYSGGSKVLTAHQTAVTSLTTTAGAHSTKSSATGAVSIAIPTHTSHLTNNSGFTTVSEVTNKIYPVGAIYISTVDTNPESFLGGQWEPIEGKFLLGASSTWTAGKTGGSVESVVPYHNHTTTTTGTHKHTISSRYVTNALASGSAKDQYTGSSTYSGTSTAMAQILTADGGHSHTISYAGDSSNTETNMPPYLAVYMWKRTA